MSTDLDPQVQRRLDDRMQTAVRDLQHDISTLAQPTFDERPKRSAVRVALVFALPILVVAMLWTTRTDDAAETATVTATATPEATDDASVGVEDEPAPAPATDGADTDDAPDADQPVDDPILGGRTDLGLATRGALDLPVRGESVDDPAFGTTLTRLTNGGSGTYLVPVTPTASAWNTDRSLIVAYRTGPEADPGHVVIDAATGEIVAEVAVTPVDIEQLYWNPLADAALLYMTANEVRSWDVATGADTTVATFDQCDRVDSGRFPAPPTSAPSPVLPLLCHTAESTNHVVLDLSTGETVSTTATTNDALTPTVAGDRFVSMDDAGTVVVFDAALVEQNTFSLDGNDFVVAVDGDGRDVLVTTSFDVEPIGSVVVYDLDTGVGRAIVGLDTGYPYPPSGTTIAAPPATRPTLVPVAIRGDATADPTLLDGEILVVDLASGEVHRVAHHRSTGSADYWSTPFVSIDPTGTSLLVSTDWQGRDQVDLMKIDLTID